MTQPPPPARPETLMRMLRRRRALTRLVLLFERLWPALWPSLGIAGAFLCLALLDVPALLPPWGHAALLGAAGLAVLVTLVHGLRRLAMPGAREADRRLERASGLHHRPLTVLADRPALPGADALWRAHLARARAQIGRLRVGAPHPGLAAHDPRAFRGLLVVALFAAAVIAGDEAEPRLARAFQPAFTPAVAAPATQIQAWITPPAYTGLAPVFLKPAGGDVSVPAGSHLTVSLTGGSGEPHLLLDGKATPFQALDNASFQADQDLAAGGRLSVARAGQELGAWDLTVIADRAPEVRFPTPPGATTSRLPQTRLPWQVSHEYGVVSLQAELRLRDRPQAPALVITIPLPGGAPKSARGVRLQDLTANPWAGLPVIARLLARDAPGLIGHSADARFTLPERDFQNPVARVLMVVRKMLTLKPDDRQPPVQELDRLAALDEVWANDLPGFVNLQAITALLRHDPADAAVDDAQSRLWQLALHLEEGALERTTRELQQARQELREALDAQQRGEKIDPQQIDRLMKNLQDALNRQLQALAEQAQRNPDSQQFDPEANRLDTRKMQRLAQQMRDAARQGRMDEARRDMAELEQMLEDLQNARPEHGQMTQQQRQRAEKRQRGQQQMSALGDIVQREGRLLDQAQERADSRPPPPSPDPGYGYRRRLINPPAAPEDPNSPQAQQQTADRGDEQKVQQALRRALGELMQQYGDLTGEVPPNLGEADTAMRGAVDALASSQDQDAANNQRKAIEALQKGGQSMSQQMARQFGQQGEDSGDDDGDQDGQGDMAGNQPGGDQYGGDQYGNNNRNGRPRDGRRSADRRNSERRDPLGRPLQEGASGSDESGLTTVPDQMEQARSRAIQEELRKRAGERTRPQPELDYIGRLLEQF